MKSNIWRLIYIKIFRLAPKEVLDFLMYWKGFATPIEMNKSIKIVKEKFGKFNGDTLQCKEDVNIWRDSFIRLMKSSPRRREVAIAFISCNIKLIKASDRDSKNDEVILMCVIKNDLEKIKMLYKHYRSIGVKHFAIIDNNSDDGTMEWLCMQEDTDVYSVDVKYETLRKSGWVNRLISIYGFERWYLYVDSDEMLVYEDMETYSIVDLIDYCKRNSLNRLCAIMLDMYSTSGIFQSSSRSSNIKNDYIFFDTDSYKSQRFYKGLAMYGGPRSRVIKNDSDKRGPLLTKYPLFYFKKGDIYESCHFIFPYDKEPFVGSALLHYKFIDTDIEKYKKIAKEGNYYDNSKEYKLYMKKYEMNKNLTFMYEGSTKYCDSFSLKKITIIKELKW